MRTDATRHIFEDTWNNPEKMEPGAQFQRGRERGGCAGGALHTGSQETTEAGRLILAGAQPTYNTE